MPNLRSAARRLLPVTAWVLGISLSALACTSSPATSSSSTTTPPTTTTTPPATTTTPPPTGTSTAQLSITSPTDNSVQINSDVTVTVSVSGLTLTDAVGKPNVPGQGHLVFYLDVVPPTVPGQSALSAPGTYAVSVNTSYTWQNLPDAAHVLWVQLVNNDNTPLSPPATTKVSISVFTG